MFIVLRFVLLLMWLPLLYIDTHMTYEVFFKILQINGPFFIKLTQLYASIHENRRLEERVFDNIHEHSYEKTCDAYRRAFKKDIDDRYIMDTHVPIASGSIGQVYRAFDTFSDQYVAIKVRHPGIYQFSMKQIQRFKWILSILSKLISIVDIDSFILSYSSQIDMRREAYNMTRFNENYKDIPFITFPKPIEFSEEIIVMTYHDGLQKKDIEDNPYMYHKVALYLFAIVRSMSIEHGFLHCDLHHGNWSFDPEKQQIIIYDTGSAMEIDGELVRKVKTHVYTNEINQGMKVFMKHMLVNDISDENIQQFLDENNEYVRALEDNCSAIVVFNAFKSCAKKLKTPIKNEMVFLYLAFIMMENILRKNALVGVSKESGVEIMKSELSLLNQYKLFPKYKNFIKDCLRGSEHRKVLDTSLVSKFYTI